MPEGERRRADDPRLDVLLRGQADLDKRLALVEDRQSDIRDDVKEILMEQRTEAQFRHEMIGAAKFSRIVQLLLAIAIALITLGNALGVSLGSK